MRTRQVSHNPVVEYASASVSLLLRLRAWLAAVRPVIASPVLPLADELPVVDGHCRISPSAAVLPFPIRGEALLVRLAEALLRRVASSEARRKSFLLTMSRRPHSRLTIDGDAYVEFHPAQASYQLVIELVQGTQIKAETTDFDTIVKFVAHYVTDRLSDAPLAEAAS